MFTQNIFQSRIEKLQNKIKPNQLILLSSASDIIYFSDFNFLVAEEREAFLLITKNSTNLIHTSFAPLNNFSYLNYLVGSFPNELADHLKKIVDAEKISTVLIDNNSLFVAELEAIKEKLPKLNIENYDLDFVRDLRNQKDTHEIEAIKKASEITSQVMFELKNKLKVGMTEFELKKIIQQLYEDRGIEELAFPIIVAFGSNSALPHHQPGSKKLENEMAVLIDMGAKWIGYCSDMTRTFWFGEKPAAKFLEIESIVKDAYQAVIKILSGTTGANLKSTEATTNFLAEPKVTEASPNFLANLKAKDLDNAARILITNKGFAEEFIHTTGHGLGLSIHEQPSLSWRNNSEIKSGMTITVEPGIYLEGEFGYRYENTVLVTKNGVTELTKPSKDL